MIECADDACFSLEALPTLGVSGERGGKHFEGDRAMELEVFSQENLAHRARPQRADDAVMQKRRPDHLDDRATVNRRPTRAR